MASQSVVFNRVVVPPPQLAEFLKVGDNEEMTLTQLQSRLYDRLYRTGAVRHLDGTRATRKRRRDRESAKRRVRAASDSRSGSAR
jgi:hypothetical protein